MYPGGETLRDDDVLLSQDTTASYFVTTCGELETSIVFTFDDVETCSSLQILVGVWM